MFGNTNPILLSIKRTKKIINTEGTQYPIVAVVAQQQGFQIGCEMFTIYWTDAALPIKQIRQIPPHIKVNHFPQIVSLTRKNKLANALNGMLRYFQKEYDFYPQTFVLPMDHAQLLKKHNKQKFYIIKPENGCQGKGIYITNSLATIQKTSSKIVQNYIPNPLLIDGLKFDMRIYVLITCIQPLRIFMYKDGLARFATQLFAPLNETNMNDVFKHLTNYAINKNHHQFQVNDQDFSKGHKRLLSSLFKEEVLQGLLQRMADIVLKSIIAVLPNLQNALKLSSRQNYFNSCFQILGYDFLITNNGKLHLLQINQNPSLMTQTTVDHFLKKQLLSALFKIISCTLFPENDKNDNKMRDKDRKELENCGKFMRIYPRTSIQQTQKFDHLIAKSQQIYKQKFGLDLVTKKQQLKSKLQNEHMPWNQSYQFYSKQKISKVYGQTKNLRISQRKRFLLH